MSKRNKGLEFQRWVKKFFERRGWTVHNETMKPIWIREKKTGEQKWVSGRNDIFGCIDLIAKKEHRGTIWIQATMDTHLERRKKELERVPWGEADVVMIFMKRKNAEVRMIAYNTYTKTIDVVGEVKRGEVDWTSSFYRGYVEIYDESD